MIKILHPVKKILVISMKTGWGHIRAAQALDEYAKSNLPEFRINHVDLCEIEPMLGKFFETFYDITIDSFPLVWGTIYETFDKEPVSAAFRKVNGFQRLFKHRIGRYLKKQNLDGIIFTNVIPAPMVAPPCHNIFPNIPMAVVVTDYHGHSYYNVPSIDHYFVAIPEVKNDMVHAGVAENKISVTGIPVDQKFYSNYNQTNLKKKLGFKNNFKTVLFTSRLYKDFIIPSLEELLMMDEPINLAMICSGNNELYKKIKEKIPPQENFKLINWADRIDEYMKASDVVVSKPGGLIISECLVLGKKLIMTDPIPGQEKRNSEFMAKYGYGKIAIGPDKIVSAVREILLLPKNNLIAERSNASPKILEYFK